MLERLSLEDLRLCWRNHWGRLAPALLSRSLLYRLMAYRLQAEAFGDLDSKTIRLLDRLAGDAADKFTSGSSSAHDTGEGPKAAVASVRQPSETLILKPGALLTREWQGRIERVMVVKDGFAWKGATYGSLSAVAFAITGTKWNGPRFFGVRHRDRYCANEHGGDKKRNKRDTGSSPAARVRPAERPHRSSRPWQLPEGARTAAAEDVS